MNLKRQLLLVSLLTLMLPWAGCQFVRETESALRESQQQMLAGTALAIADSISQYEEEFPAAVESNHVFGDQLFGHTLETAPTVDGYFDDWTIGEASLRTLRGSDGSIQFALGLHAQFVYLYVEVVDLSVVYADAETLLPGNRRRHADRIQLISASPPYQEDKISFAAEAPGPVVSYVRNADNDVTPEPTVRAFWQDVPRGYHLEARIPLSLLGTNLGLEVDNTAAATMAGVRSASFSSRFPGAFVTTSAELSRIAAGLVQQDMRLIVTDASGWRIATAGGLSSDSGTEDSGAARWLRLIYDALVEPGTEAVFAEPDPSGREQQSYVTGALSGDRRAAWFRSNESGRAIVAVAEPVMAGTSTIGTVVLQKGTVEILSLTNRTLARLMNVTLIAMLVVGATLLGYATWISRRIQRLSIAAEDALDNDRLSTSLPSSASSDEIGDLSRSFSYVLTQLGDYNEYLRTLASKLSHELRTPLAIVTSSLENLEHEPLNEASAGYTARAKDGADRLRRILSAMSEASRVEELMKNADPESFDLQAVLTSTVAAYCDVYRERKFVLSCDGEEFDAKGSPELVIQMLDKLVDNAVSFSAEGDVIDIGLSADADERRIDVRNPGPPLPERMKGQLFDSMISLRPARDNKHLGLGLYVAKLIADGHGGRIAAENTSEGVQFSVWLPATRRQGT